MNGCELMKCSHYVDGVCKYDSPICKYRDEDDQLATITAERDDLERVVEVLAGRLVMVHVGCKEVPNNSIHSWTEWAHHIVNDNKEGE
jgi:hypothetical protein